MNVLIPNTIRFFVTIFAKSFNYGVKYIFITIFIPKLVEIIQILHTYAEK